VHDGENVSLDRWAVNFMQMTYAHGLVVVFVAIVIVVVVAAAAAAFNQQMRDRPQHHELRPLLFSNSVWVLLRSTEINYEEL